MKDLIIKQKQLPEKSIKYMKSVVAFDNQRIENYKVFLTAWLVAFYKFSQNITHLIMEVDFCPVLCIPEVPVLRLSGHQILLVLVKK